MLDTFNFANPQTCNYQEFYGGGSTRDWIKPRGVSMVRFLLIGAGGAGVVGSNTAGGTGGGSGAITTLIVPAMFIPDELRVTIGAGGKTSAAAGDASAITWQGSKTSAGYDLLIARGSGLTGAGGIVSPNNSFGAAGIYNSIAGQNGANPATAITASTTTFLSGGAGGSSTTTVAGANVASKYGYPTVNGGVGTSAGVGGNGYFITQPLLLGTGGAGGGGGLSPTTGGAGGKGAIGCGGGGGGRGSAAGGAGGAGGDGAVFIWSW
jgi:hypothetical protein